MGLYDGYPLLSNLKMMVVTFSINFIAVLA